MPAPGRADGHAGAGQHGGEAGGLDPEVAQDAQHQRDVQRDGDDRAQVLGQRGVDAVAVHAGLDQADDLADQPAADDPEGDGGQHLDGQLEQGGAQEVLQGLHLDRRHFEEPAPSVEGLALLRWDHYGTARRCGPS
jgi:hypothetical protein